MVGDDESIIDELKERLDNELKIKDIENFIISLKLMLLGLEKKYTYTKGSMH